MPRSDTARRVQTLLLAVMGLGGCAGGWFLPAPASYAGVLMGMVSIGSLMVLQSELNDKIKEERQKLLHRDLRERSRRGPDA
ncbi:hypothetical protein [Streptomyces murinus]|uniref:hypothetical protein n=1 Tax=Streptomyces murinus TaxID=33900 RepID=UPI003822A585